MKPGRVGRGLADDLPSTHLFSQGGAGHTAAPQFLFPLIFSSYRLRLPLTRMLS